MTRPLVKICGISEPEHALIAVEAGADFIGLVFYPPSHRHVSPARAADVVAAVKENRRSAKVRMVGLFVNQPPHRVNQIARDVGLDLVQLHGDERPETAAEIELPVIPAVRVDMADPSRGEAAFSGWATARTPPAAILLDTHVPGRFGGTGTVGDWDLAAKLARQYPVILAGGLTPGNAADAIDQVRPYAVDVSSGVETNTLKDPDKIRRFIQTVRQTQAVT